jgi:hypothetical protein
MLALPLLSTFHTSVGRLCRFSGISGNAVLVACMPVTISSPIFHTGESLKASSRALTSSWRLVPLSMRVRTSVTSRPMYFFSSRCGSSRSN